MKTPKTDLNENQKTAIKRLSADWGALGAVCVHPKTAESLEKMGIAEKQFTGLGTTVSRVYDWRLTKKGLEEKQKLTCLAD